jgi:hypothetical protein
MRLHSVQPIDKNLIGGKILTELFFGAPVAVICAMRLVEHVFLKTDCKGTTIFLFMQYPAALFFEPFFVTF